MIVVRPERPEDAEAIRQVVDAAFQQSAESILVDRLREDGDLVLSLVAEEDGAIVGHVAFSRLYVEDDDRRVPAVALAPLSVERSHQGAGLGARLVADAHAILRGRGETLSVVLGDPDYYSRLGYRRDLAEGFDSAYQSEQLQAIALAGDPPRRGLLRYALAFTEL